MHAGAVVAEQRLGHERDGLVVLLGDVLDDVLVEAHLVAHLHELVEPQVDFALAGGGDFVVLGFDVEPALDHRDHHLVADVHQGIGRRHGEVAFLVAQLVAEVGFALRRVILAAVPLAFFAVDVEVAAVGRLIEADVVEDEELGFGADEAGVGDAGALQVIHRLAGDVARIARVVFARDRVLHVADHAERRDLGERIDERGVGLRQEEHVALVDRLPAADAGAVEAEAVFEDFFIELGDGDREVLPDAGEVHEAHVDGFDVALAAHRQDRLRGHSCHDPMSPMPECVNGRCSWPL